MSTVQIQNANLLRCITAAADAGVAPGTPLTAVDEDGNEVEWSMASGIKVTFEILDDDDESGDDESGDDESGDDESGDVAMTARDKPKLGYGLTPKATGVCTKFYQYISIDRAYEEVRYRKQGYKKVVDKWVKPGKPVNDEAIHRGMNKGEWLNQPEFLVDRPAKDADGKVRKDADGNAITEKVPLKEVGGKYSCNNLKPSTLRTLLAGAVVEPKTPPKPAAKPKTPSAPKKKTTASKTTAPKKKTTATKFPSNQKLINAGTGRKPHKCKDAKNKAQIREWILANSDPSQLQAVLKLHGIMIATPKKKGEIGKSPQPHIEKAYCRNELREIWGM
jgi:hypothetical protein